jgi:hypothetical protein
MIFSHVLYQLSYPATYRAGQATALRAARLSRPPAFAPPARRRRRETRHDVTQVAEAGATGLEPATSDVTGRRSNQLNYAPATRLGDYRMSLWRASGRSRI